MNRCTHVVWLDVDDVLVDFCGLYNAHISSLGYGPLEKDYVPRHWNYSEIVGGESHGRAVFAALPPDWPLKLEAKRGAVAFTWRLHRAGARVILITSLEQRHASARIENLVAHGFYFDEIYFTGHGDGQEKHHYIDAHFQRYGSARHIFIDDYAKNVVAVAGALGALVESWTFDRPYNDQYAGQMAALCVTVLPDRETLFDAVVQAVECGGRKC